MSDSGDDGAKPPDNRDTNEPPTEPPPEEVVYLELLPDEVWEHVLQWVGTNDALRFRLAGKEAKGLIDECYRFRQIRLVDDGTDPPSPKLEYHLNLRVRTLAISSYNVAMPFQHPYIIQSLILAPRGKGRIFLADWGPHAPNCNCRGLEDAYKVSQVRPANLDALLRHGNGLKNLELFLQAARIRSSDYLTSGYDFPNLETLEVSFPKSPQCLLQSPWNPDQNVASIVLAKSNKPKLRSLTVTTHLLQDSYRQVWLDVFHCLSKYGEHVEKVFCGGFAGGPTTVDLAPGFSAESFKNCTQIRSFILSSAYYFGTWIQVLGNQTQLAELRLEIFSKAWVGLIPEIVTKHEGTLRSLKLFLVNFSEVEDQPGLGLDMSCLERCYSLDLVHWMQWDPTLLLRNLYDVPVQVRTLYLREFVIPEEELRAFLSRTDMQTEDLWIKLGPKRGVTAAMLELAKAWPALVHFRFQWTKFGEMDPVEEQALQGLQNQGLLTKDRDKYSYMVGKNANSEWRRSSYNRDDF